MASLPTFPAFDLQGGDLSKGWRRYVVRFENLLMAMNITDAKRKKAMLLHYVGEDVVEIFETLDVEQEDENEDVFVKAEKALRSYFTPRKNTEFEVYKFRQAKQLPGEDISTFYTRLKQLATSCEFHDEKREIKTQIIQNGISTKLRRKALADPEMTLEKILQMAKSMELAESQAEGIESANRISKRASHPNNRWRSNNKDGTPVKRDGKLTSKKCSYCAYQHVPGKMNCPAYGKQCRSCHKWNHFRSCCNAKPVPKGEQSRLKSKSLFNPVKRCRGINNLERRNDDTSSSEDEYVFTNYNTVSTMTHGKLPQFKVKVNGTPLMIMADTGASVNILDGNGYARLKVKPQIKTANEKVYPYGSTKPLPLVGKCECEVETEERFSVETFFIVKGKYGCLMSWVTSQRLGLIQVAKTVELEKETAPGESNHSARDRDKIEMLVEEYDDLFHGLGKLKDFQVHLHVDKNVQPIAQAHRRVPFHVRQQLEEQLKRDEELGVIEHVEGPTPWVSPVVIVPKGEGVRVCIDMRQANLAIKRERHISPTINELIHDLNGAKLFSKLDLNQGYNQLELDPESRYLTTFSTHVGLRRLRRLNFGVNCAAEIFQTAIR